MSLAHGLESGMLRCESVAQSNRNCAPGEWLKPELGFSVCVDDMDMQPRLFARKEEEPEPSLAEDRWTHRDRSSDSTGTLPFGGQLPLAMREGVVNDMGLVDSQLASEPQVVSRETPWALSLPR
jgi:hypothetical protein